MRWSAAMMMCLAFLIACAPEDLYDDVPPAAIDDLKIVESDESSVTLSWTAVGDDGLVGTAAQYDIRHSDLPSFDRNFGEWEAIGVAPLPAPAGEQEFIHIDGLELKSGHRHYFALKVLDESENVSGLSNEPMIIYLTSEELEKHRQMTGHMDLDASGLLERPEGEAESVVADLAGCWVISESDQTTFYYDADQDFVNVRDTGSRMCLFEKEIVWYFHERLWYRARIQWSRTGPGEWLFVEDGDVREQFVLENNELHWSMSDQPMAVMQRLDVQGQREMMRTILELPTVDQLNDALRSCLRLQEQDGVFKQENFLPRLKYRDQSASPISLLALIHENYAATGKPLPDVCDFSRYYAEGSLTAIRKAEACRLER